MIKKILDEIEHEYNRATKRFGAFHNTHEGYAVLLEEVDELWEAIKKNNPSEDVFWEAIQVAAMAVRLIVDCCKTAVLRQNSEVTHNSELVQKSEKPLKKLGEKQQP